MARLGRTLSQRAVIVRNRALALANTAGGQADETVVSVGNSAAGGALWDAVTIGADATLVYDQVGGVTWYRVATGATTTVARAEWTSTSLSTGWTRYFGRAYFRIPAATLGTTIVYLFRARAGAAQSSRISVSTGNRVQLRNASNSSAAQGAVDIVADTNYRVEWDITVGAAAPGTVYLYAGDSTTALESITVASADFGTGLVNELGFGMFTSTANHPPYWLRGFQVNNTALPGPLGDLPTGIQYTATPADAADLVDTATRVVAMVRGPADTAGLTDAAQDALAAARTVTDTADLVDAATRAATNVRVAADTAGISDTVTVSVGKTAADQAPIVDTAARAATVNRTAADTAGLVDEAVAALGSIAEAADAAAITDAATRAVTAARTPADTAGLLDAPLTALAAARTAADTAGISDAAVLARARQVADSAGLADAATTVATRAVTAGDTAGLADAVTAIVSRTVVVADTAAIEDQVTTALVSALRAAPHRVAVTSTPSTVRVTSVAATVRRTV